jgi:hypothetical protein
MLKIAVVFFLLNAAPAMAFDKAFLGTWAPDALSCGLADSNERFTVTPKKFSGREFACTLKHTSPAGSAWRMQYSCDGEGDSYSLSLKWRMGKNGHLLEQAKGETREYMRCDEAKAADTKKAATAADDFTGKYTGSEETYRWEAVIARKDGQSFAIQIGVSSQKPLCSGEMDAIGQLRRGRIVTQPDKDDSCVLTISKTPTGIAVEELNCSGDHGAACMFTSSMNKIGQ